LAGTSHSGEVKTSALPGAPVVQSKLGAGILVELAVQLAAVGAPVVLTHEALMPDGVADDTGLFHQDLLLEPVDHLLPTPVSIVVVEHHQAVGIGSPQTIAPRRPLVVCVDDGPGFSRLRARAADKSQVSQKRSADSRLRLVVLAGASWKALHIRRR